MIKPALYPILLSNMPATKGITVLGREYSE